MIPTGAVAVNQWQTKHSRVQRHIHHVQNAMPLPTFSDAERHGHHSVRTRNPIETADEVGEVVQYAEVMLYYNHIPEGEGVHEAGEGGGLTAWYGNVNVHLSAESRLRTAMAAFSLCFTSR